MCVKERKRGGEILSETWQLNRSVFRCFSLRFASVAAAQTSQKKISDPKNISEYCKQQWRSLAGPPWTSLQQPTSMFQTLASSTHCFEMAPSGKVSLTRPAAARSLSSWLNCPTAIPLGRRSNRHSGGCAPQTHTHMHTHTHTHTHTGANCPPACQSWGQLAGVEEGGGGCRVSDQHHLAPFVSRPETSGEMGQKCCMCTVGHLKWSSDIPRRNAPKRGSSFIADLIHQSSHHIWVELNSCPSRVECRLHYLCTRVYSRLKRLPPLPAISPFEYWYANDEQHREQSLSATTGNRHNGSSVRPWHFYHPTCVPGFMLRQWRPTTVHPFTYMRGGWGVAVKSVPTQCLGTPTGYVWPGGVFYPSLSGVGTISFLEQW